MITMGKKTKTFQSEPEPAETVYDSSQALDRYAHRGLWYVESYLGHKYLSGSGKILDVACAGGRTAIPLADYGDFDIIGFDISFNQVRAALKTARTNNKKCAFLLCDMTNIAMSSGSIDYVLITYTSLGAITTVEDRHSVLKEVVRVLKPEGLAFISVWNILWPGKGGLEYAKWFVLWLMRLSKHYQHGKGNRVCREEGGNILWHYFFPWEAKSLFKKNGMDILEIVPYFGSWENHHTIKKNYWSLLFSQGLFFVLKKSRI